MKSMHFRHLINASVASTMLCLAGAAFAQYAWIDEKGVKQFSDMPPPASVPTSRILKGPRDSAPAPAASAASPASPAAKTEMTVAEKDAEFRKRRAERAEKDKKETEASRLAADKSRHCERAREYNRALGSGERIARLDQNGERAFLTDAQRAQEQRETRRVLDDCR